MDAAPSSSTLRDNLRAVPPSAWVHFGGTFVNRIGTFVLPFFTLYLTGRGFSAAQAGVAVGAYGLGGFVAQSVGGLLADRIGRRNTIALSMLSTGALTLVLWRAQSLALIYLLMFGVACLGELHRPASGALIADLVPAERRVTAFTVLRSSHDPRRPRVRPVPPRRVAERIGLRTERLDSAASRAGRGIWPVDVRHPPVAQRCDRRPPRATPDRVGPTARTVADGGIREPPDRHRLRVPPVCGPIPTAGRDGRGMDPRRIMGSSSALAIAADRAPEHARGRYQSALGSMWSIAFTLGPIAGTVVYSANPAILWWGCGALGIAALGLCEAARRTVPTAIA
jgi:hypothetical protein